MSDLPPRSERCPEPADQAAVFREAADECDKVGAAYASRAQNEHAAGAFALMEKFLRMAHDAEMAATPCSGPVPCEDGGEPCDRHERMQAHGEGDHELCGPECKADRCTCDSEDHTHDGGCALYGPAAGAQHAETGQ